MARLIRVGFFSEMPHGNEMDPRLAEMRAEAPALHQDAIVAYLEAGHIYIATPGLVPDVLDRATMIGPPHYQTDGRFVWPGDLAHYVRKYNVRLPLALVEHMMANDWKVPTAVDLSQLEL